MHQGPLTVPRVEREHREWGEGPRDPSAGANICRKPVRGAPPQGEAGLPGPLSASRGPWRLHQHQREGAGGVGIPLAVGGSQGASQGQKAKSSATPWLPPWRGLASDRPSD